MAKSKKKGHVAIPFLLAFLLGILGIGGIAMYLFNQISAKNDTRQMVSNVNKPTEEDNMTLMFVLDEPKDACPVTFLTIRVLPLEKKMILISLPSNMLAMVDDRQDTLTNFYRTSGIQGVITAVQNEAGIYPDRYMILNSESFQKICNIFAGVNYQVPLGTQGFTDSSEPQNLGPAQIEKLITNPFFEAGESERSAVVSDVISEMINQTDYDRIVSSMDSNFRTLINMMTTDVSSIDYSNEKSALKFMYTYGSRICTFRLATGSTSEDNVFILSNDFQESISDYFSNRTEHEPAKRENYIPPEITTTEEPTTEQLPTNQDGQPVQPATDENGEVIPWEEINHEDNEDNEEDENQENLPDEPVPDYPEEAPATEAVSETIPPQNLSPDVPVNQ
ncbi:MAG: LCP family protein [Oscillospiraceae bacterium]|nr:LCP family protein [Oscillospiraceae bacterium]